MKLINQNHLESSTELILFLVARKLISPYITKPSKNTTFPIRFTSEMSMVTPPIFLLF